MASIYRLALRQLTGRFRLLIMAALALLPVIMALVLLAQRRAPTVSEFETVVFSGMLSGSIIPLVVLAIAAAAFANEVEDRTLANLTLSPLPRWRIVVPKLLAVITIASPFVGISAFVTSQIAYLADAQATIAVTLASLAAVALYASAFVWLGLVTTHAIALGLLYIVLWEGFFSGFVSGVRLLSIRHYSIALMHAMDERRFSEAAIPGIEVAIIVALVVFAGFLLLSIRRLRRMDVP